MRKVLIILIISLIAIYGAVQLTDNGYLIKGLRASYLQGENSASIGDAKFFDTKSIETDGDPWEWSAHSTYNQNALSDRLSTLLEETESIAFFVAQNDSVLHEYYWDDYSSSSHSNSFSAAKTIVTMLAQIAIQNGNFKGWDQNVTDFLPELTGPYANELKLWHLSTMSSGLDWDEKYKNPFSITAKAYYGDNIWDLMLSLPIMDKPGTFYNYQSGSTQLLGMALIRATDKTLSELASDWLWKPMQANYDAKWHTDEEGIELAYCCFNTNARDFARFGKLMLNYGNWDGLQILDSSFIDLATKGALVSHYGYSFWINDDYDTHVFAHRGILGQYIISIPEYNVVIVRLGHHRKPSINHHPEDFRIIVEEVLKEIRAKS